MKIALIGFGGMGKTLHRIAISRGHSVPVIIDPKDQASTHKEVSEEALKGLDIAIDFSSPDAVLTNAKIANNAGTNLVIGTTGWYDHLPELKEILKENKIGLLWSSNFSIGVNLYFAIMEQASKLINKFDEYDIWGHEIHHYNKADSPSGTAKTLEKILLDNIERKTSVVEDRLNRKREPNEIHFSSVRGGLVNFGHTVGFDSEADTITITHSARNRDGYALGAIKAAEWLNGKKGLYEMKDFLNFNQ